MLKNFPEPQFFHLFCGDTNTYPMELGTQRCHRWQSHPTLYTLQASGSMVHNECTYGLYLPLPRRTWEHGPLFLPFIRPIPWDGQEALIISCITGRRQIFCNKCWCVLPLLPVGRVVLKSSFPHAEGIRYRLKRNQTRISIEGAQRPVVVVSQGPLRFPASASGRGQGDSASPCHRRMMGELVSLPSWTARDQARDRHSLLHPVFGIWCAQGVWTEGPGVGEGAEWWLWGLPCVVSFYRKTCFCCLRVSGLVTITRHLRPWVLILLKATLA